jgi:hypothetical protein
MRFERKFALQQWLLRSAPLRWLARLLSRSVPKDKGFEKFKDAKEVRHDDTA